MQIAPEKKSKQNNFSFTEAFTKRLDKYVSLCNARDDEEKVSKTSVIEAIVSEQLTMLEEAVKQKLKLQLA